MRNCTKVGMQMRYLLNCNRKKVKCIIGQTQMPNNLSVRLGEGQIMFVFFLGKACTAQPLF